MCCILHASYSGSKEETFFNFSESAISANSTTGKKCIPEGSRDTLN